MKGMHLQIKRYSILLGLLVIFTNSAVANNNAKNEVKKSYEAWCSAIGTARGDASKIVKFYAPKALLLPTLSPKILVNADGGLNAYFVKLTSLPNIKCSTDRLITNMYGTVAINSGLYTFTFTDSHHATKSLAARFTFVYEKTGDQWLIVNHHSSELLKE
jgi:uncharacterized protein (TIGR02246 family)